MTCSSQTSNQHTIINVSSLYIESVVNNDIIPLYDQTKNIENVIAFLSKQEDSITTYTFNSEDFLETPVFYPPN